MEKQIFKVFVIHQWMMSDLQKDIINRLNSHPNYDFVDMSYPESKPIENHDLVLDYACGAMMDSDIIIILPDLNENQLPDYEGDSLYPLKVSSFRKKHGSLPKKGYLGELQTIMYDSCSTKPVLVLGWTKESAEKLARVLDDPEGVFNYTPDRFYTIGVDEIRKGENIVEKIVSIIKNFNS